MVIVFTTRSDPVIRRAVRKRVVTSGVGYGLLLSLVLVAAVLHVVPGTDRIGPANQWLGHPYRLGMAALSAVLAVYLGCWSAYLGGVTRRALLGLAALVGGGVVTGIALAFAPMILYPNNQYPVTFLWLVLGAPLGLLSWMVAARRAHIAPPLRLAG